MKKIAIIGMGHLGKAIEGGLLASGFVKEDIITSNASATNRQSAIAADLVIIAVKPLVVADVIKDLGDSIENKILISVAAGVSIAAIEKQVSNKEQKIVRLMPNLPIQYTQGILGFYANSTVTEEEKKEIVKIFSGLGKVIECNKEEEIDMITVIAGCGPALVAYFISLLTQSAEKFGLEKPVAEDLALQTVIGTVTLMQKKQQSAESLQAAVATKGGVTAAIINALDEKQFPSQFVESLEQGYAKIEKIKVELEK